MSEIEIKQMQEKIDAGILLAQKRLIEKTKKEDGAWNTGGTREIATTPDNDKSKLIEIYANTLKCSSLNLSEKVKFNSGGRVVAGSNPVTPTS